MQLAFIFSEINIFHNEFIFTALNISITDQTISKAF